ncbi:MAG: DUF1080 domain-containing protein [Candidatus Solibacter usitatus]|nr:DUF1080 domain-containing protein [Candidatus Solibacter usitatus]
MPTRRAFLSTVPFAVAAQTAESGFQPLDGWTIVEGPETAYSVTAAEIAVQGHATFPTWLRSAKQYENFDLRGEFFVKGWTDSGIYIHAPEHGRPSSAGFQIKVFHQKDAEPKTNSVGAILGAIAPRLVNVQDGWNDFRVLCNWPRLQVWMNGALVHDHNCATHPELNLRLRSGYIGIAAASVAVRFRNFRIRELPGKEQWSSLYEKPEDLAANWAVSEGKPDIAAIGGVLRGDGAGHMATKERYRDFHFQCYIRGCAQHNGGIIFRSAGRGTDPLGSYEIQLHPVEESHFPTGSLYHLKRAVYPRIQDEKWFHFDLWVVGREVRVRIDGETVLEYDELARRDAGFIELQTHRRGYWLEFKHIRVQRL